VIQGLQIEKLDPQIITWVQGPRENSAQKVLPPESAGPDELTFVSNQAQFDGALERRASMIIALDKVLKVASLGTSPQILIFKTPNIARAMSVVLPLFDQKKSRFDWGENCHPSAVIHPTAKIGENVKIGPHAVIGAKAQIGDNTIIGAGSVIEAQARIGARSLLHSQVFVGAQCEIGDECEIHPHTTIGSDGFGFTTDSTDGKFHHHKIPQLGKVVIENNVEIGANCAIDRATLTVTRIKSGTKFDNFCHVAHNCELGENGLYAAGFFVAGSSKIGQRFMCGGNVVVTSHVELTDGVILAGRSTVTNDVTEPGQYGGYPLQPLKDAMKTISSLVHIYDLRKKVQNILKHLEIGS